MRTPVPPDPFPADFNLATLDQGLELWRVHDPIRHGAAFNPCLGGKTRFAPVRAPSGDCIPTLYAAATFEAAVHESIFHDVPYNAPRKFITRNKLVYRAVSRIRLRHAVDVARLNEPDLNRIGLTRAQLIDTEPTAYPMTARWAEGFHASGRAEGLGWSSRRCEPDQAFVFFEDRAGLDAFEVVERLELSREPALLDQIYAFASRGGITITL